MHPDPGALQCNPAPHRRPTVINAYRIKYINATDIKGAGFKVTRIDDGKSVSVSYDYGANNAIKKAVHDAFGEDFTRLEFVGALNKNESLYAIHH